MNEDLHGSAPDKSRAALLLIDVINDLDFPEATQLLQYVVPMAERIAALKVRARRNGVPTIFVNDNFGRWRSDFKCPAASRTFGQRAAAGQGVADERVLAGADRQRADSLEAKHPARGQESLSRCMAL